MLLFVPMLSLAQSSPFDPYMVSPQKEQAYLPYLAARHGGPEALLRWKQENRLQYRKELWYFAESFEIKRNHVQDGIVLDAAVIDISRFEHFRLAAADTTIVIPGYRDGLFLQAANKLLHKPEYVK
jgi:hypothetical protein